MIWIARQDTKGNGVASVIVANYVDVARLRDRVLTEGKSPVGAGCREVQSRAAAENFLSGGATLGVGAGWLHGYCCGERTVIIRSRTEHYP